MVARLLRLFPCHRIYVEVFGGTAVVLLNKPPSQVEVYNDIDRSLVNFYRVLRDEQKFEELIRRIELTPYSRDEYNMCRRNTGSCSDDIEMAREFFVFSTQSFAGKVMHSFGTSKEYSRGMSIQVSSYISKIESLPAVHKRLRTVLIECLDFRELIPKYDDSDTLFYLDPPYVPEERRSTKLYRFEMSREDHEELVELLLRIKGKAVLSGYQNKLYSKLESAGWKRYDFEATCHVPLKVADRKRVESVWVNAKEENIWLT